MEGTCESQPNDDSAKAAQKDKPVAILSLDGGGMRGVFALHVLRRIELVTGRKIRDLFDLICGTSTGGIIALGLVVARLEVQELLALYRQLGARVFSRGVVQKVCRVAFTGAQYDNEPLKQELLRALGDAPLSSCTHLKVFVVSSTDTNQPTPFLFRNYDLPDAVGTSDCTAWEAALASAAAHTCFDAVQIHGHGRFRDGGVVANNPSKLALQQAQALFPNRRIGCMVSVGTGRPPVAAAGTSAVAAIKHIVKASTNSHNIYHEVKQRCEEMRLSLFRFDVALDLNLAAHDDNAMETMLAAANTCYRDQLCDFEALAPILVPPPVRLDSAIKLQQALLEEIRGCESTLEVMLSVYQAGPQTTTDAAAQERELDMEAIHLPDHFRGIVDELSDIQGRLATARELVSNLEVTLAVLGTHKGGKSTAINALVGKEIMPRRDTAMTSIPVLITLSPEHEDPVLTIPKPEVFNACIDFLREKSDMLPSEELVVPWAGLAKQVTRDFFRTEYHDEDEINKTLIALNDVVRATHFVEEKLRCQDSGHGSPRTDLLGSAQSYAASVVTTVQGFFTRSRAGGAAPDGGRRFEHNPLDKLSFPNDFPRVWTKFGDMNELEEGTRVSLVDCPGYNEAGYPADEIMGAIMKQTNAVLPVLDYTTLTASTDPAFEVQIRHLLSQQDPNKLFVLVNKFDQSGKRTRPEETQQHVAQLLKKLVKVRPERVFPVSAKWAFESNHVGRLLDNGHPINPDEDWVAADFVDSAFGQLAEEGTIPDERIRKGVSSLYEKSKFGLLLRKVVADMLGSVAPTVLRDALRKVQEAVRTLLTLCRTRQGLVQRSAKELRDVKATLQAQQVLFQQHRPSFKEMEKESLRDLEARTQAIVLDQKTKLREEWGALFSEEKVCEVARVKGLRVHEDPWFLWQCNSAISFSNREQRKEFEKEMSARFCQLHEKMHGAREELELAAKKEFYQLEFTIRQKLKPIAHATERLLNGLNVSLDLEPLPPEPLELPSLELDPRLGFVGEILYWFSGRKWTTTNSVREDLLKRGQKSLEKLVQDDHKSLAEQIRQQVEIMLGSFSNTLLQIRNQIQFCEELQRQVALYDEQELAVAGCVTQLEAANVSLNWIQNDLKYYALARPHQ
jgi:predicted acylesterase/phospholipase RssA